MRIFKQKHMIGEDNWVVKLKDDKDEQYAELENSGIRGIIKWNQKLIDYHNRFNEGTRWAWKEVESERTDIGEANEKTEDLMQQSIKVSVVNNLNMIRMINKVDELDGVVRIGVVAYLISSVCQLVATALFFHGAFR